MKKSLLLLVLVGGAPLAILTAYAADVKANWGEHCAKCHGDDGKGQTKMGRKLSISDMSDPKVQAKFTDEEAMKAMKEGVKDSAGKVAMKPIEGVSEPEMKELIAYLRALKK